MLTTTSDAEDTKHVYQWRLEQEAALRASKGAGMSDEQVYRFVDGCKSYTCLTVLCSELKDLYRLSSV